MIRNIALFFVLFSETCALFSGFICTNLSTLLYWTRRTKKIRGETNEFLRETQQEDRCRTLFRNMRASGFCCIRL